MMVQRYAVLPGSLLSGLQVFYLDYGMEILKNKTCRLFPTHGFAGLRICKIYAG